MLQVIPNYTKVKTVLDNIPGMTTAFTVRAGGVEYEITYMLAGEAKSTWMAEQEFIIEGTVEKQEIGFKVFNKISEEQKQREISQILGATELLTKKYKEDG